MFKLFVFLALIAYTVAFQTSFVRRFSTSHSASGLSDDELLAELNKRNLQKVSYYKIYINDLNNVRYT